MDSWALPKPSLPRQAPDQATNLFGYPGTEWLAICGEQEAVAIPAGGSGPFSRTIVELIVAFSSSTAAGRSCAAA
jgi:hypothetical protein